MDKTPLKDYMINWIEKVYQENKKDLEEDLDEEELLKIKETIAQYNLNGDFEFTTDLFYFLENYDNFLLHELINTARQQIEFDLENTECDKENGQYLGYINDNGVEYIGVLSGGDWEHPIFYILFLKDETLKTFVPRKNNIYNKLNNSAIGNDEDLDEEAGFTEEKMTKIQNSNEDITIKCHKEIIETFNILNNIKKYSTETLKLELSLHGYVNLKRGSKSKVDNGIKRIFENEEIALEVITTKNDDKIISIKETFSKAKIEQEEKQKRWDEYLKEKAEKKKEYLEKLKSLPEDKIKVYLNNLVKMIENRFPLPEDRYTILKQHNFIMESVSTFSIETQNIFLDSLKKYEEIHNLNHTANGYTMSFADFDQKDSFNLN